MNVENLVATTTKKKQIAQTECSFQYHYFSLTVLPDCYSTLYLPIQLNQDQFSQLKENKPKPNLVFPAQTVSSNLNVTVLDWNSVHV